MEDQLAELASLNLLELRSRWQKVYHTPPPRISRDLMALAVGFGMQAKAYGGLAPATRRALTANKTKSAPTRALSRGTRLVREWKGTGHIVVVGEDGAIRWNYRDWHSLSEVARAITGTRWSGPAFFGTKRKDAA